MNPDVYAQMHLTPCNHNAIFCDHIEAVCNFIEENSPISRSDALNKMTTYVGGVGQRRLSEYLKTLDAWKVTRTIGNKIYWNMGDKKNVIPSTQIKEEITDGAIHDNITMEDNKSTDLKPCKHRNDKLMTCSVTSRITQIKGDQCNHCGSRCEI